MKDYFDNLDVTEKNLKYLTEKHGEIYEAYEHFGRLVHEKGGPLDEKTRWLIKIAVSASCQYEYALRTHILKALKSGCSKEEIEHAILLIAPTAGFPKMMEGLLILRHILEHESDHEK
jgi:AhpD family alkylhydroperoxidase